MDAMRLDEIIWEGKVEREEGWALSLDGLQ